MGEQLVQGAPRFAVSLQAAQTQHARGQRLFTQRAAWEVVQVGSQVPERASRVLVGECTTRAREQRHLVVQAAIGRL